MYGQDTYDPDRSSFSPHPQVQYSLGAAAAASATAAFRLDPHSGVVTLRAQLDREATPLYELPVVARDGGTPQR